MYISSYFYAKSVINKCYFIAIGIPYLFYFPTVVYLVPVLSAYSRKFCNDGQKNIIITAPISIYTITRCICVHACFDDQLLLRPCPHYNRFQTKTILFCSGYGYRPHYNAENDHRKRKRSPEKNDLKTKTLS